LPGDLELASLLYQALQSPCGIVVRTNNFQLARQKFYATRREIQDSSLAELQFRQGPLDPAELWISKTSGRKTATPSLTSEDPPGNAQQS